MKALIYCKHILLILLLLIFWGIWGHEELVAYLYIQQPQSRNPGVVFLTRVTPVPQSFKGVIFPLKYY